MTALVLIVFFVAAALVWNKSRGIAVGQCTGCEPVAWLEGVSAWPSHLIHLAALAATAWALDHFWSDVKHSTQVDAAWLGLPATIEHVRRQAAVPRGFRLWLALNVLAAWRRPKQPSVRFLPLWHAYLWRGRRRTRAARVAFWYVLTLAMAVLLFRVFSYGYVAEVPVRGAAHRDLVAWTLYALLLALPLLVVTVADATLLEHQFIERLCAGRVSFPASTITHFAHTLGAQFVPGLAERRAADPLRRRTPALSSAPVAAEGPHTLLDDWITVRLVARHTRIVGPLVIGPFVVLALMIVARSRLFDNWAVTLPGALVATAYLVWLMTLAALLKFSAERLRRQALRRMNADLRWLAGSGDSALTEAFQRLVASVETNTTGAFASFFDQPLFKALLVPLGGAGGAQLLDQLLLGR